VNPPLTTLGAYIGLSTLLALLVADLHAHLLVDEVIGFCAGTLAAAPNRGTDHEKLQDRPRRSIAQPLPFL